MPADMRLVQLARMLSVPLSSLTPETAVGLVSRRADDVADALFREAADSDDVTGVESALEYLDGRLHSLGDLVSPGAADAITTSFAARLKAWET